MCNLFYGNNNFQPTIFTQTVALESPENTGIPTHIPTFNPVLENAKVTGNVCVSFPVKYRSTYEKTQ
ncbi:hypothetical protein CNR22_06105 [Sphingobacteriaceae bacterium]|nr:hypothetical protein CNR22_06105 [Sphingobacteriaceae bacterium]